MAATTWRAPPARSARAAAARVAPVVATSSITSTTGGTEARGWKRGPARRARADRPVCAGPGVRGEEADPLEAQAPGERAGDELGGIETPGAAVLGRGGRPGERVDPGEPVARTGQEHLGQRVGQPWHRGARAPVLGAGDELAGHTFVGEG